MHDSALHGEIDLNGDIIEDYGWDEMCPRCMERLSWVSSSWYCSTCTWKDSCCGG